MRARESTGDDERTNEQGIRSTIHIGSAAPSLAPHLLDFPSPFKSAHTIPTTRKAATRHGERDDAAIDRAFRDPEAWLHRQILDTILSSTWYLEHEHEPRIGRSPSDDPIAQGLGIPEMSIYTVFLAQEDNLSTTVDKSQKHFRCLFGSESSPCGRGTSKESTSAGGDKVAKVFDLVEDGVDHIRSHLDHRPFPCDSQCGTNSWYVVCITLVGNLFASY